MICIKSLLFYREASSSAERGPQKAGVVRLHIADPLRLALLGGFLLTMLGITTWSLVLFRRLVQDIAAGNPFAAASVVRLRCIAWSLIGLNLAGLLGGWLLVPVLAAGAVLADGRALETSPLWISLVPLPFTVKSSHASAWIELDVDFWFTFYGLIFLALAEAFRIDLSLKDDNEGIV